MAVFHQVKAAAKKPSREDARRGSRSPSANAKAAVKRPSLEDYARRAREKAEETARRLREACREINLKAAEMCIQPHRLKKSQRQSNCGSCSLETFTATQPHHTVSASHATRAHIGGDLFRDITCPSRGLQSQARQNRWSS
jgi:hypothetical protein